jgi:hypothetical protein
MPAPAHLAIFALLAANAPSAAQELEPEQASLLERARETALRYSDSLPDFLCTEVVGRKIDPQGNGRWIFMDSLTVKLSYFGHMEDYKLMEINGKSTLREYKDAGGAVSTGEFGTRLYSVFDPRSRGDFHWKGWTTLRKRRVARFSFRVAREDSIYKIQYGPIPEGPNVIIVPYHGEVWVDEETHMALRLTQEAEIPYGFPITANASTVDYDFAEVAGKRYLLPSHALVTTRSGRSVSENAVEFHEYRKFQADTILTFEPPPTRQ